MRELPGKKEKAKTRVGLAAALALLSGIASGQKARPADLENPEVSHLAKENNLNAFGKEEITRLEGLVEGDAMSLKFQVKFLEEALRQDGPYAHEFSSRRLTAERQSRIYQLADTVSARLTLAYKDIKQDKDLSKYFHEADKLREATTTMIVEKDGKKEFCNRYFLNDNDEIFSATAYHCVKGSTKENEYYRPAYSDVAVKYIPREKWNDEGVKNASALPHIDPHADHRTISGKVITSFSWAQDKTPKVHFSFAMPLPANFDLVFNEKDQRRLSLFGAENWMMFFKPYSEGLRKPETGLLNAAGSSGGPIAIEGMGVAGGISLTKEVTDACRKTCHAAAFFTSPEVLRQAIADERKMRNAPH